MKLFKVDITFKRASRGRIGAELVVHAEDEEAAKKYVAGRFTGSKVDRCIEIHGTVHFTVADIEPG